MNIGYYSMPFTMNCGHKDKIKFQLKIDNTSKITLTEICVQLYHNSFV